MIQVMVTTRLTHIRETTRGQTHSSASHQHSAHDKQIWMWLGHLLSDLLDQRQDNESGNSVADKRCYNKDQGAENNQHTVQTHALNASGNRLSNCVQKTRRVDRLAERETTGSKDDDSPEEIVKVFLGKDTGTKEKHNGDNGYDTHIAKCKFKLVTDTP